MTDEQRQDIAKHYENLKLEMMIDAKQLSEQNKIKTLEAMETALEKRLQRIMLENEELSCEIKKEGDVFEAVKCESDKLSEEMKRLEIQEHAADEVVKHQIKELILQNEKMKHDEITFKEECKRKIEEIHKQIEESEKLAETPDEDVTEFDQILEQENENLRVARLQLAKKNRAVVNLQRQLDNIPDNIELNQYQKRFLELYNSISNKYKETKQFYTLYNTLDEKKVLLDKELTILNGLYDNYQAMTTLPAKEQFLNKLEEITDSVESTKSKFRKKHDDEKLKREELNSELLGFIELQRKYVSLIKKFKFLFDSK